MRGRRAAAPPDAPHHRPYWHGVACVEVEADGFSRLLASAHLAPSSPAQRQIEVEAFRLIAESGALVAAGDWNAVPASDRTRSRAATTASTSAASSTAARRARWKAPG